MATSDSRKTQTGTEEGTDGKSNIKGSQKAPQTTASDNDDDGQRQGNTLTPPTTSGKASTHNKDPNNNNNKHEEDHAQTKDKDKTQKNGKKSSTTVLKSDQKEPKSDTSHGEGEFSPPLSHKSDGKSQGPMSIVKQAALLNCHLAIEDSVDIDRIWDSLRNIFHEEEQDDIQTQLNNRAKIRRLLDHLPNKHDQAFDALVHALEPHYKWLSHRLQESVQEEEIRLRKMGKGIRRKIALALLTARISERQKDGILDRVTSVVEAEIAQNTQRVNIPDHRTEALLQEERRQLKKLIRDEVDPLLFGDGESSARENYDDEDYSEDAIEVLGEKLEELQLLRKCYEALDISKSTTSVLPSLLLQKIEEVKTGIKILNKDLRKTRAEAERVRQESLDRQQALSRLEEHNRGLEMDKKTLESDRQWLEERLRKYRENTNEAQREYMRAEEENAKLKAELQQATDKASDLSLRNRSMDDQNAKLTRDNLKLTTTNARLRQDARGLHVGAEAVAGVRADNRKLATDRQQLRREVQRAESERRQLVIMTHKLEAENRSLREQKRRLLAEKKRAMDENRALKREAKRLTISRFSPLPPINESLPERSGSGNDEKEGTASAPASQRSQRSTYGSPENVLRTSSTGRVGAVTQSYERSRGRQLRRQVRSPWNRHRLETLKKPVLPRGRGDSSERRKRKRPEDKAATAGGGGTTGEAASEGKAVPTYMKATRSSRKHEYYEDESPTRPNQSPRRAAAWK